MKIASWNVNSLRQRLPHLLDWLNAHQPDLLGLQEIKCQEQDFPIDAFTAAGWCAAWVGQKTFNGVAVISKKPVEVIATSVPKLKDEQARYLEVELDGVRFINIYAPNGNPIGTEKFDYKIRWLKALYAHAQSLLVREQKLIIAGDFNIIPCERDVWDESRWLDDALCQAEARALWRSFLWHGFSDAIASHLGDNHLYTFWDYQKGAWQKDWGIRIDHFLLSPQAADCLEGAGIDKRERGKEKPSDHVPVWIELT